MATTEPRSTAGEDVAWTTPFPHPGVWQRIWVFAVVAVVAEASLAWPPGPASGADTIISIALVVVTAGLVSLPWNKMPSWATVIVPCTYVGSVLLLILAAGGSTSGVGVIILIPLVWTALYHRRWESIIVTAAIVAVELVISLYPLGAAAAVIVRRVGFWGVLGVVVSFGIHSLRERLLSALADREALHATQTEHLRRTEALAVAAEELTAYVDARAVIDAAVRLAAQLVSPPGVGPRRSQYLRLFGETGRRVALYDESDGVEVETDFPIAEHPTMARVFSTGEATHGPVDLVAVGPVVAEMMIALGLTHTVFVPVKVEGTVDGVLGVAMRGAGVPAELFEHCKAIGHLTELALRNAIAHERLHSLATTDSLTGVANRRSFEQSIVQRPGRGAFSVLVIDLDGLKVVNDGQGHQAGDEMLVEVARSLNRVMRRGDVLARVGGDEFAVLAFDADLSAGREIAERMLEALRTTEVVGVTARASIGLAAGQPLDEALEIFHAADSAMYAAKREGGDRFAMATPARR